MNIQYYGHSCFKISTKPEGRGKEEVNIFIDPFDKSVGLRPPQGQADVVLVSHDHPDHNNVEALKGDPYAINIPGEYSVKGVNIIGIESVHGGKGDIAKENNTIYVLESEGIRVCHLGDLGVELTAKQLDTIDGVDILMVPVGGTYTIDGKEAAQLIGKIEPHIVVPMHFKLPGSKEKINDEKQFCNEMGNCPKETVAKISIKAKEITQEGTKIVLMKPQ